MPNEYEMLSSANDMPLPDGVSVLAEFNSDGYTLKAIGIGNDLNCILYSGLGSKYTPMNVVITYKYDVYANGHKKQLNKLQLKAVTKNFDTMVKGLLATKTATAQMCKAGFELQNED